jgi:hypothetical protein
MKDENNKDESLNDEETMIQPTILHLLQASAFPMAPMLPRLRPVL